MDSEEYERDMTAFMEDLEEDNRVTIGTSTSFLVRCMYMCSDIDKTYTDYDVYVGVCVVRVMATYTYMYTYLVLQIIEEIKALTC